MEYHERIRLERKGTVEEDFNILSMLKRLAQKISFHFLDSPFSRLIHPSCYPGGIGWGLKHTSRLEV
ncbi:hypothetical protein HNO89_002222 [Sporosarcina luteola]|nr:hypothetical protein [Sporosarcina luteola]